MSELYFMMTITSREMLPKFLAAYDKNNLPIGFVSLGYGTAKDDILDMLGLVRSEKAVGMTVVTGESWKESKQYLRKKMYIDVPDTGISFIIPMSSIGGKRELAFLTARQNYRKGEESVMKDTTMELLVVVSNQGHNDLVMERSCHGCGQERRSLRRHGDTCPGHRHEPGGAFLRGVAGFRKRPDLHRNEKKPA